MSRLDAISTALSGLTDAQNLEKAATDVTPGQPSDPTGVDDYVELASNDKASRIKAASGRVKDCLVALREAYPAECQEVFREMFAAPPAEPVPPVTEPAPAPEQPVVPVAPPVESSDPPPPAPEAVQPAPETPPAAETPAEAPVSETTGG